VGRSGLDHRKNRRRYFSPGFTIGSTARRSLLGVSPSTDGSVAATPGRVNVRSETPFNAIIATTAATALVALSGALQIPAALSSVSILGVSFAACLAVLRRKPDRDGVHLPGAKAIAVAGAVTTAWLLAHLSTREFAAVCAILIAGVLYASG
jgi:amino acid transporter